ncbi:hypothetical protein [Motilimonas pumila]|nr:hypothetical protein [Motilimonas pumila]
MAKLLVAGYSNSRGKAKSTGRPYNIARLHVLTKIREWSNDNGRGIGAGFETADDKAIPVNPEDTSLEAKLLELDYPAFYEVELSPNPEDPTKNIVTNIKSLPPKQPQAKA